MEYELDALMDDYVTALSSERALSSHTITAYHTALQQFRVFLLGYMIRGLADVQSSKSLLHCVRFFHG